MTESTNAPDFDLEAWLDGAKRTERAVTVYSRGDLLADIDKLEAEQRTVGSIPEADRAMSDGDGSHLQAQIDELYLKLDASKLEMRVTFLDDEEQAKIRDEVKSELKSEADAAAKKAAVEAREQCTRSEITLKSDVDQVVRRMTAAASEKVIEREVSIRTLSACLVHPPMSPDQVRKLYKVIGDSQVAMISAAYARASVEAPEVQVPKLRTPSRSDDGRTSS